MAAGRRGDREALGPLALKSSVAALAVDVDLRRASANAYGADSLVHWLERLGSASPSVPRTIPYDSIVSRMLDLGGTSLRTLYASGIAGGGRLPYADILAGAGLELASRQVEDPSLGASLVSDGRGGFAFRNLVQGGLADRMGIRAGDRLVSVNGQPVSADNLLPIMAVVADLKSRLREGEPFRVEVERSAATVELEGKLEAWTRTEAIVVEEDRPSRAEAVAREAIFAGRPGQAPAVVGEWPAGQSP
jgi:predicted metalloprotease with PDZ domain